MLQQKSQKLLFVTYTTTKRQVSHIPLLASDG